MRMRAGRDRTPLSGSSMAGNSMVGDGVAGSMVGSIVVGSSKSIVALGSLNLVPDHSSTNQVTLVLIQ